MPKLALQLYSLRREAELNPEEVFLQVPGLGFDSIELASDYGWSTQKWKAMLAQTGLKVVGTHAMLSVLETNFDSLMEHYRQLGNPRIIVPWLEEKWRTVEGFQEVARQLNKWAPRVRDAGFIFCYHNHDFEFQPLADGSIGYDILLKNTDPALVKLEVDTYWVEKSGRNAAEFLTEHKDRVSAVHAKEIKKSTGKDCAAGDGDIDFKKVVELCVAHNWPVIVEYEGDDAIEVVRRSAQYLSKL